MKSIPNVKLKEIEDYLNLPSESIVFIGNDANFKFLGIDNSQGLNVDKIPTRINVLEMLQSIKFVTPICLSKVDKRVYIMNFANVERDIVLR